MDRTTQRRAVVLTQVLAGALGPAEAAGLLNVSVRHLRRLKKAYLAAGPAALVHGNRGRVPWNALEPAGRDRVVDLARTRYAGLNCQHLAERLAEDEGLVLDRTTVRRLLVAAGLRPPRTRRVPRHRRRRERLPREGLLLQADGSRHRWLGPDGPYLTLVGAIDDATGTIPAALFRAQEDAAGYLLLVRAIAGSRGLPWALYVDRHGIFVRSRREPLTVEEELAGGPLPTQVGRALAELHIEVIHALSPQAKGRVERLWGTLQDRLVAELRLHGISTLEAANAFLPGFLLRFNARFGVPAADPTVAYRPLPEGLDLERVCCFKYTRAVRPDNTIVFGGRALQLPRGPGRASWARVGVEVREHLDGRLAVVYRGTVLATSAAPLDAPTLRARPLERPAPACSTALTASDEGPPAPPAGKPGALHPWRRFPAIRHPPPTTPG